MVRLRIRSVLRGAMRPVYFLPRSRAAHRLAARPTLPSALTDAPQTRRPRLWTPDRADGGASVSGAGTRVPAMIIWADGLVTGVRRQWSGAAGRGGWGGAVVAVARRGGEPVRALAYTTLMASPEVGDRVLLNVA